MKKTGLEELRELADSTHNTYLTGLAYKIEQETIPRPRFEDGTPVQIGDSIVSDIGITKIVTDIIPCIQRTWIMCNRKPYTDYTIDNPVKRPDNADMPFSYDFCGDPMKIFVDTYVTEGEKNV